jgi:hypothetical protein
MLAREQLERDECRAAARRALVLQTAPEQLELLPVPKLTDRAVGDGTLAVVRVTCGRLELVFPLDPESCQVALSTPLGEPGRLGSRCGELRQR